MERIKNSGFAICTLLLILGIAGGCSAQFKKERHLARAEKYFVAGEYEKAKIEFLVVRKIDPANALALVRLGRIYLSQGSAIQAINFLLRARQLAPHDPDVLCAWGELLLADGKFQEARDEFLKALEKNPTNTTAILLLPYTAVSLADVAGIGAHLKTLPPADAATAPLQLAWATLYSRQNKTALAEAAVAQALRLAPDMPEAHAAAAMLLISQTNLPAADEAFKKAADLAAGRSPILLNYANFKIALNQRDAAKAILKKAVQKVPDFLPAWDALARLAFEEAGYPEALALTDRTISQDPFRLETYKLRALVYNAIGNPGKAVQEWEQVDKQFKNSSAIRQTTRLELARACVNNRQPELALRSLEELLSLASNRLDRACLEASLLKGNILLSQNRGAEVVNFMGVLLQRTNIFHARLLMADGYRQIGRAEDALNVMRGLAAENPKDAQLAFTMGLLLREQNKFAEARRVFLLSRQLNPPNIAALVQIVDLDISTTNHAPALKLVQEELARTNTASLRYLEGLVFVAQERWKDAETSLIKALELDNSFPAPYYLLTTIYVKSQRLESAVSELEVLLRRQPGDIRALMLCGSIYSAMEKYDLSRQAYERLLAVDPRFSPALNNLAYLYSERLGKLEKGYELARKAWSLSPTNAGVADTLGWILYKKGDYQPAIPLLRQAAEAMPESAESQFHLGMASCMVGQTSQARAAFQRAITTRENFPGKDEARRRLDLLNGSLPIPNAISELEALLQSQPRDVSSRLQVAELYEESGDFQKAAHNFEQAFKLNSQLSDPPLHLARLLSGPLADPNRALPYAQKACDLAPDNAEAHWLLGRLVFKRGDHPRSYALLHIAVRQPPVRPEFLYDYAWAAYSLGRISEAGQSMRDVAANAQSPQAAEARSFLEFHNLSSLDSALPGTEEKLRGKLKIDSTYVPALFALASLERARGHSQASVEAYESILRVFPNFIPATRELALLLATDPSSEEKAHKLALKARENLPNDTDIARALGLLTFKKGDFAYARTLLEQVAASKPEDAEVLFRLGLAHLQLKDKPRGKQALERSMALNLRGEFQAQAKAALAQLQ